jgi:hypothetical protein
MRLDFVMCMCVLASVFAIPPVLVTYGSDHMHDGLNMLRHTARWHGWSALHVIGSEEGFQTHGLVDKLVALRKFAKDWPDQTILVFVDGYDVVVNNEPTQLETAFLSSGKRIMFSSELGCCTSKKAALQSSTRCHPRWPFMSAMDESGGRPWLNSGVIVGYAPDIRKFLRMAWKEYQLHPAMYRAFTDQLIVCHLMSEGSTVWTRASVGIDHSSEIALSMYNTDVRIGQVIGLDSLGRIVFSNRTVPAFIHFNGPKNEKKEQIEYATENFPLLQAPGRWRSAQ